MKCFTEYVNEMDLYINDDSIHGSSLTWLMAQCFNQVVPWF